MIDASRAFVGDELADLVGRTFVRDDSFRPTDDVIRGQSVWDIADKGQRIIQGWLSQDVSAHKAARQSGRGRVQAAIRLVFLSFSPSQDMGKMW